MKAYFFTAAFFSLGAFAQIPNPNDLILDSAPSSLRFLGKKLMQGSISVKSCIFENDRVVVVYGNCTSRKEAPATSIKILSKSGGMISTYIENSDAMEKRGPISTHPRSNYDRSWKVSFIASPEILSSDLYEIESAMNAKTDICYTNADLQPLPGSPEFGNPRSACTGSLRNEIENWSSLGLEFWREPGQDWYRFLREMRQITSLIP